MSGITAQQLLRSKEGVIVTQVRSPQGLEVQVRKNSDLVSTGPGDCLGVNCHLTFLDIWSRFCAENGIVGRKQTLNVCHSYLGNAPLADVLAEFNFPAFENRLLPLLLTMEGDIKALAEDYVRLSEEKESKYRSYVVYDVLCRIFIYVAKNNIKPVDTDWDDYNIVSTADALKNIASIEAVLLSDENDVFLPAFKAVHPNGKVVKKGELFVFLVEKEGDFMKIACGGPLMQCVVKFDGKCDVKQMKTHNNQEVAYQQDVLLDPEEVSIYSQMAVRLLVGKHQKRSDKDQEVVNEINDWIGPDKMIGRHALAGFGGIVGEGTPEECLVRGAKYLARKSQLSPTQCLKLAAVRLGNMQGNRRVVDVDGAELIRFR